MSYLLGIVLVSIISPLVGFIASLLGLFSDSKHWKIYIFSLSWCIAIIGYCFEPTVVTDLTRYFDYLSYMQQIDLWTAFEEGIQGNTSLYTFTFFSWNIAQLGDFHILPALSTFFTYYICFYITYNVAEIMKINKREAFKYIIFAILMLSFFSIVNNIRNILAFAIVGLAIYRDIVQKNRNIFTILFYFIAIFFHTTVILFILVRFFIRFIGEFKLPAIMLIIFIPAIFAYLSEYVSVLSTTNGLMSLVYQFILKGNNYYTREDAEWAVVASKSISILISKYIYSAYAILLIIQTYFVSKLKHRNELIAACQNNNGLVEFIKFEYIICLLIFASLPMVMPEYWRFASMAVIFGAVISFNFIKIFKQYWITKIVFILLNVVAVAHFILWIRNMINYSDLMGMLFKAIYCNPLTIIISNLFNLHWF